MARRSRKARATDVREIALALPEVEETVSWGDLPTFAVRRKGFLIYRGPRPDAVDDAGERLTDVIVIRCSAEDKEALVADESTPFFTTPHFNGYRAVLVQESRLAELSRDELAEVITDAWVSCAPKRLAQAHLRERGA